VSQKEKLLGLNEIEVVGTLGKPDQQEIYKRHEKFYYYFLDPSPECENAPENPSRRLIIRFNAVGLSKEINVE
jgi:outer membrane protein assembly factor BamE (lipoprotein component of BamABCDE complex)